MSRQIQTIDTSTQLNMTAGTTITAGQLLTVQEDGLVFPANSAIPAAANSGGITNDIITTTMGPIFANTTTTDNDYRNQHTSGAGADAHSDKLAKLSNGNVIQVSFTPASPPTTVVTQVLRPDGTRHSQLTAMTSMTGMTDSRVYASPNGNIMLLTDATANNRLQYRVISDNNTTAITSTANVALLSVQDGTYWGGGVTGLGDFVVHYLKSDGTTNFQRYNNMGVLQGIETQLQSSGTTRYSTFLSLANNDFLITYYDSSASRNKVNRITANGTIVFNNVACYGTTTGMSSGGYGQRAIELTGGNLVVETNISGLFATIMGPTGSLVANVRLDPLSLSSLSISNFAHPLFALGNGNWGTIIPTNGGTFYVNTWTSTGVPILDYAICHVNPDLGTMPASGDSFMKAFVRGNKVAIYVANHYSSGGYAQILFSFDGVTGKSLGGYTMQGFGTAGGTNAQYGLRNAGNAPIVATTGGDAILTKNDELYVNLMAYIDAASSNWRLITQAFQPFKKSIIGVARNSANVGQPVLVDTKGSFKLASDQYWFPGRFNCTSLMPQGNKGTVSGNFVNLEGIETIEDSRSDKYTSRLMFATPGIYSITTPSWATEMKCYVVGGGANGSASFGGNGGGYSDKVFQVSSDSVNIIVGSYNGTSSVKVRGSIVMATGAANPSSLSTSNVGYGIGGDNNFSGGNTANAGYWWGTAGISTGGASAGSPYGNGYPGGVMWGGGGGIGGPGSSGANNGTSFSYAGAGGGSHGAASNTGHGGPGGPVTGQPALFYNANTQALATAGTSCDWFDLDEIAGSGGGGAVVFGTNDFGMHGAPGGAGAGGGSSNGVTGGKGGNGGLLGGGGYGLTMGGNGGHGGGGGAGGSFPGKGGTGLVILMFR